MAKAGKNKVKIYTSEAEKRRAQEAEREKKVYRLWLRIGGEWKIPEGSIDTLVEASSRRQAIPRLCPPIYIPGRLDPRGGGKRGNWAVREDGVKPK